MSDNTTAVILGLFQLLTAALAAYGLWQNQRIKAQGEKQGEKMHEMGVQLDGITERRVTAAGDAGQDRGLLRGAAQEQAREATRVATADASAQRLEEIRGGQQP
jgi:hypothetical protein